MVSTAEHDVIGRHGVVGVDVLPHDIPLTTPVEIGKSIADQVDEIERKIARERAEELAAASEQRRAQIALAETVEVSTAA